MSCCRMLVCPGRDENTSEKVSQLLGHKGGTLIGQDLRWDANSAGEQEEFLGDGFGILGGTASGYRVA